MARHSFPGCEEDIFETDPKPKKMPFMTPPTRQDLRIPKGSLDKALSQGKSTISESTLRRGYGLGSDLSRDR